MKKKYGIGGLCLSAILFFAIGAMPAFAAETESTVAEEIAIDENVIAEEAEIEKTAEDETADEITDVTDDETEAEHTEFADLKEVADSINEMLRGEDYEHLSEEEIDSLAEEMFADAVEEALAGAKTSWTGPVLTRESGINYGPSGKESYYNLNMSRIVSMMHDLGYKGEYWVREDGCKMFGDYIMCAANLGVRPRGSLVESSLGTCMVCDTGSFAIANPTMLDIAVTW